MNIVRLEAENFKRLKAVSITPKGAIVPISGKNAQGKSSVLDAIWAALGGATHIQSAPIRHDQTKARIRLDLGEIIVTRSFTKNGTTLTVENAEGLAYKSPQKMLDDLVGALAFDPLEFTRMKPRQQYDVLKGLAHIDLDLEKLEAENQRDYAARTAINKEAKSLRAQIENYTIPEDPGEIPDAGNLLGLIEGLRERKARIISDNSDRIRMEQSIASARTRFAELRQQLVNLKADIEKMEQQLEELPATEPTEDLDGEIDALEEQIQGISALTEKRAVCASAKARLADLEIQAEAKEAESQRLTEAMEARTKAKEAAISKATMPIPNLGFGDGLVLFQGVPFEQASSAEQLRVSTAIAMAANPKLKVVRITDGSLLDSDSLAMLHTMAEENGYQVWLEVVSDSKNIGVVISDGEVVADNQVSEPTKTLVECAISAEPGAKAILAAPETTMGPMEQVYFNTPGPEVTPTAITSKMLDDAHALIAKSKGVINTDDKLDRRHAQGLDLEIPC